MSQKSIQGGGPAFPRSGFSGPEGFGRPENGMTLRDYFAAKAMQAYFTDPDVKFDLYTAEAGAQAAYRLADAMLAAR